MTTVSLGQLTGALSIVEDLAAFDPTYEEGVFRYCHLCDSPVVGPDEDGDTPEVEHTPECLHLRARLFLEALAQ